MKQVVLALVMACCTLALPEAIAAPDPAAIQLARSHYEKGNASYNLAKYEEAIGWFTKAYEAWPVADFLYNIAQSYRLAGNCNQALFFYRRYLAIKDHGTEDPLSKQERAQIEQFIKELTDCEALTRAKPSGPKPPTPVSAQIEAEPPPSPGPPPSVVAQPSSQPAGAAVDHRAERGAAEDAGAASTGRVTAYAAGGLTMFSVQGKPAIPAQPVVAVGAGYALPLGGLTVDLGARGSFSPIEYGVMASTARASLIGLRATVGATYRINARLGLRGDAGIGVAMLRGLVDGNPFTTHGDAGAFTMMSLRLGLGAEYAITPSLVATLAPLGISFTQAPDALIMRSVIQLDMLAGLGYRL